MALFESYRPRGTWIDRIDPRTKLAWMVLVMVTALVRTDWIVLAVLPALVLAVSLLAGIPARVFYRPAAAVMLMAVQLSVLQLLFSNQGHIVFRMGPVHIYSEAVPRAVAASLRLTAVMAASLQFISWTPPGDLALMLVKAGIPYRFAMLAGLAMRFLPLMEMEFRAVFESQGARGLPVETAFQKLKAMVPVAMPFLFRAFRRANDTALAMELRGFGRHPKRTFPRDIRLTRGELAAVTLMAAVTGWELWLKIRPLGL